MADHTPGPWEVRGRYYIHRAEPGAWSHAEVKCSPGIPHDSPQHEANARLIAAAPDLLAACKQLVAAWSGAPRERWEEDMRDAVAAIDDAIAGATGPKEVS